MQNSGGELQKEDAALLTVLLLPLLLMLLLPPPPPLLLLLPTSLQTCIGLLAYPTPSSAPPDSQMLLHPSFRHHPTTSCSTTPNP